MSRWALPPSITPGGSFFPVLRTGAKLGPLFLAESAEAMDTNKIKSFLSSRHPFDALTDAELEHVASRTTRRKMTKGEALVEFGHMVPGLFVVETGYVEITSPENVLISVIHIGDAFGERGLLRDGRAPVTATCQEDGSVLLLPQTEFHRLVQESRPFAEFFDRRLSRAADKGRARRTAVDLTTTRLADIMTPDPITVAADETVENAARTMRDKNISCLLVAKDGALQGIVTTSDLTSRILAEGRFGDVPVREAMTPDPKSLSPEAVGFDAFVCMVEHDIGHFPVVDDGALVGIVTRTQLLKRQDVSAAAMMREIARESDIDAMAKTVKGIPQLLARLVGGGAEHYVVTRLITDVADACTRRLLVLAEQKLGPPPVPYLWLACGSQGRREQTGVSDQDNCLILDDTATGADDAYFAELARFVSDGLDACGYYYCPGEMMATNPRWRRKLSVWREYFAGWIRTPDPMAQMLASVMFDLRPISGDTRLFEGLHAETLANARGNSIFVAHMVSNSLKHQPPLSLFRGVALIRSGEHKDKVDMKLSGVVPVVDLGRIYALMGEIEEVGTHARLVAAREKSVISSGGGSDLIDAYNVIAEARLRHQMRQIREGDAPDNFLAPSSLSDLAREHMRDAFAVVKSMQAALGQGRQSVL